MENTKANYGLVLSGGGVKGVAQIGAIKALEEFGIFPTYISGTSSGAIVGAFYAAGYDWKEMLSFFRSTNLFSFQNYPLRKPGIIDSDRFSDVFKKIFSENSFEALKKNLFITTSDLIKNEMVCFHQGELIKPLLASAAFPGVFSPIKMNNSLYADGGITNNFPIEPLLAHCDKIIGIYVNPVKKIKPEDLKTSVSVMERAYSISRANISMRKFNKCDLVICPEELNHFGTFSISHIDEIFDIGYQETVNKLKIRTISQSKGMKQMLINKSS